MFYSPWVPLLWGLLLTPQLVAATQCYFMDGNNASNSFQPCNPSASVSACCERGEVCMSSGLCFSQIPGFSGLIYAEGCTLQSGQDPACPQANFCGNLEVSYTRWNVLQCEPNVFCCREQFDTGNCCGYPNLIVTQTIGTLITTSPTGSASAAGGETIIALGPGYFQISQGSSTTSTTASNIAPATGSAAACPPDKSAMVGGSVGGVLGLGLLGAMGAIVYLVQQAKRSAAGGARGPVAGGGPGVELEGRGASRPIEPTGSYSEATMDASEKGGLAEAPGRLSNPAFYHNETATVEMSA